jgi:NitT/TauT family transport system substrate-binding protein
MSRKLPIAAAAAFAATVSFAGTAFAADAMPKVTMMVGGIDKQIYLEYQLAQSLGMF